MPASKHVKESFTSRDTVAGGEFVCLGCVASQNETADITLLDGEQRRWQKVRGYSWIISPAGAFAGTKSHRQSIMQMCLDPPQPPFVISLSDSGQKHLLYRAKVNWSRDAYTITLEGEAVYCSPPQLRERIELCKKLIAATGKPALSEPVSTSLAMRVITHYQGNKEINEWLECCGDALSRLAAWLSPAKEECIRDYPPVPATAAGI